MKRFVCVLLTLFTILVFQPTISAAGTTPSGELSADSSVFDSINNGETTDPAAPAEEKEAADGTSSSIFPLFIKFILSFGLVIALLFFVLKYLAKRNGKAAVGGPVVSLGGRSLGNHKSVQVIMVGQTIYVLGVGDDVTLLRALSEGEEYRHLLAGLENQTGSSLPGVFNKDAQWNKVFSEKVRKLKQQMEEGK